MPPFPAILLLLSLAQDPPVFEGAKLAVVPGPQPPRGPDPASGLGSDGFNRGIRGQARRAATVPAVAVPAVPAIVEDRVAFPSGWKAYRVEAPPRATLHARLRSGHEGWFRVRAVNKWGQMEQGMLQNRIPTGNPEASYVNPNPVATPFFFLVDTTEDGAETETFQFEITIKK